MNAADTSLFPVWTDLRARLRRWERGLIGGAEPSREQRIELLHTRFADLCADMATSLRGREQPLGLAVAALGPAGDPPAELWAALAPLGRTLPDDDPERALELAIAWGCGWGRAPTGQGWAARWPDALFALRRIVESSVRTTFQQIVQLLADAPPILGRGAREEARSCAGLIAVELAHGLCRCGNHRRSCKQHPDGSRSCGQGCCTPGHNLREWTHHVRLRVFVAEAVRGSAARSVRGGALLTGSLYRLLTESAGVLVGPVEFKICHVCHADTIRRALGGRRAPAINSLRPSSQEAPKGLYEGPRCPTCRTPFLLGGSYSIARKNWLLIPYDMGGAYTQYERWRCVACRNLFPLELAGCPLCGMASHPQRPTAIWAAAQQRASPPGDPEPQTGPDDESEE